ncbi:MAG: histidine ammonia-lyase [Fimbriimonadales bacterium]
MTTIWLNGEPLSLSEIDAVANGVAKVGLGPEVQARMAASRATVEQIVESGQVVYGVNTGFGKLSDIRIPHDDLKVLQLNLVRSHACGVGEPLPRAETRAMMLLRANVLAKGFSGARFEVAERLVDMLNHGMHPVVPARGSVGASGDLAPLAHLALGVIGEGPVEFNGTSMSAARALGELGWRPIELQAKEGLALLNGTQAIGAVGGLSLVRAHRLLDWADQAGAMTLEALLGTPAAFDPRIHAARPHEGQNQVAERLRDLLAGSEIRESHRENDPRVQDPYCLRCMPQVHGAVRDAVAHATRILETESGSATDNPLVFPNGDVISGGNFHGAPLAGVLDYVALSLTDLASISERRIDRMLNPDTNEGLPAFLCAHPGISSGFMMAHVTAAALLNEAKVLSHPASVDSVPTSAGKEDHVSMGMTSALKLRQVVANVAGVLAIEAMVAAEALEYRKPLKPGVGVARAYEQVRTVVPRLEADRMLGPDIDRLAARLVE